MASAFLGFLGGTLINHRLTQRRADRERQDKQVDIVESLIAEIAVAEQVVRDFLSSSKAFDAPNTFTDVGNVRQASTVIYDGLRTSIGFLGATTCAELHQLYRSFRYNTDMIVSQFEKHGRVPHHPNFDLVLQSWLDDSLSLQHQLNAFVHPLMRPGARRAQDRVDNARTQFSNFRSPQEGSGH